MGIRFLICLQVDDLHVDAFSNSDVSNVVLWDDLRAAQHRAHSWGGDSRITFDPAKEHSMVLQP